MREILDRLDARTIAALAALLIVAVVVLLLAAMAFGLDLSWIPNIVRGWG